MDVSSVRLFITTLQMVRVGTWEHRRGYITYSCTLFNSDLFLEILQLQYESIYYYIRCQKVSAAVPTGSETSIISRHVCTVPCVACLCHAKVPQPWTPCCYNGCLDAFKASQHTGPIRLDIFSPHTHTHTYIYICIQYKGVLILKMDTNKGIGAVEWSVKLFALH